MTVQEMKKRKKELGYTYADIANLSGLPLPTVQKVLGGITKSPRYSTILALEKVLQQADRKPDGPDHPENTAGIIQGVDINGVLAAEAPPVYNTSSSNLYEPAGCGIYRRKSKKNCYPLLPDKQQGEYTREDREMLPEDVRTELIDGVIYDMASPKAVHQIILMELSFQLRSQIEQCGRDCMVFIAPSDVWLTNDNKNIFQPDIYVVCDYSMIDEDGYTKGAPPFVIEILSPSTRSKDLLLKSYKYHTAGVHEYWIVDPDKKRVIVYDYDKDPDGTENTVYSFEDTVPVGYSGGKCIVDFKKIRDAVTRIEK